MGKRYWRRSALSVPDCIRKLLLSWLVAVTIEYTVLPSALKSLQTLSGIAQMSLLRILVVTAAIFVLLCFFSQPKAERWSIVGFYTILAAASLISTFSWAFLIVNLLLLGLLIWYAIYGWNGAEPHYSRDSSRNFLWQCLTGLIAVLFFLFVSIWTVSRIYSYCTPTFDFGIFAQMFYNMKTTGLPTTTVERDGLLSHFHVHVSPIYYILLPFYYLFPFPATLQILQAAVLACAVIPLWKICKQHGLSPALRTMLCGLLLLYPAYSGGASYDIHENAFLTPLILWLFYCMDRRRIFGSAFWAVLVLFVKEDAAVYIAVIALYYIVHSLLHRDWRQLIVSTGIAVCSVVWFLLVTGFLSNVGDGVMTYRYNNFMYDKSGSLISVIKAVIMCPMKAVFECVDTEKLQFIALTVLPFAALPLFTRRYERYILLIPYLLINLMSDYQYQHSIFFQYTYGSTACLIYMLVANLADIKTDFKRIAALGAALCICFVCFVQQVIPKASAYPKRWAQYSDYFASITQALEEIPDDASVAATTFYTTQLSQRPVLYDIQYASLAHILSTDYIALDINYKAAYAAYATTDDNGFENFVAILEQEGYRVFASKENTLVIYIRAQ